MSIARKRPGKRANRPPSPAAAQPGPDLYRDSLLAHRASYLKAVIAQHSRDNSVPSLFPLRETKTVLLHLLEAVEAQINKKGLTPESTTSNMPTDSTRILARGNTTNYTAAPTRSAYSAQDLRRASFAGIFVIVVFLLVVVSCFFYAYYQFSSTGTLSVLFKIILIAAPLVLVFFVGAAFEIKDRLREA